MKKSLTPVVLLLLGGGCSPIPEAPASSSTVADSPTSGAIDAAAPTMPDLAAKQPRPPKSGHAPRSCANEQGGNPRAPSDDADGFCDLPTNRDRFAPPGGDHVRIRFRPHVIRDAQDALSATPAEVTRLVADVNAFFSGTTIELIASPTDVILDPQDRWASFATGSAEYDDLVNKNNDPAAIDGYFVARLTDACGRAGSIGFAPARDHLVQETVCGADTLAHEIGHLLGLYHTHHPDDLCADTPPDPGPPGAAPEGTGLCDNPQPPMCMATCTDGSMPDTSLLMSYYQCADVPGVGHFSAQQISRMRCYLDRNNRYAIALQMPCQAAPEVCDGLDQDCDGLVDEYCVGCQQQVCMPDARRCQGQAIEVCSPDGCRWASGSQCACGCANGVCSGSVCAPGARRCNGGNVEACVGGCGWMQSAACACGCANGACPPDVCTPGARRCNGGGVEVCAGGCGWTQAGGCACGCANGACTPAACTPGARRCNGQTPEWCSNGGCDWTQGPACVGGMTCINGSCACLPGWTTCNGACRNLQSDRTHCGACGRTCGANETCVNGTCKCAQPVAETCDGKDNDCDGQIDEGYVCPSSLRVAAKRVNFTKESRVQVVPIATPPGGTSCVPLVAWERLIEHSDDQCDFHARYNGNAFELSVEHCDYGHYQSPWIAVAHVALLCSSGASGVGYREVWTNGKSSDSFTVAFGNLARTLTFCSLDDMDGEGDVDMEARCKVSRTDRTITGSVDQDFGGGGAYASARLIGLEIPNDVGAALVPFAANANGVLVYARHAYDKSGPPHHLAFVMPNYVNTDSEDHGSLESTCTDNGAEVVCSIRAYGSIDNMEGSVLFLDGNFPYASDRP